MQESELEKYLIKEIENIGGLCWKFVSPGTRGVPDRIIVIDELTIFVEVKKPNEGEPSKLQLYRIQQLENRGQMAIIIDDKTDVDELITKLLKLR